MNIGKQKKWVMCGKTKGLAFPSQSVNCIVIEWVPFANGLPTSETHSSKQVLRMKSGHRKAWTHCHSKFCAYCLQQFPHSELSVLTIHTHTFRDSKRQKHLLPIVCLRLCGYIFWQQKHPSKPCIWTSQQICQIDAHSWLVNISKGSISFGGPWFRTLTCHELAFLCELVTLIQQLVLTRLMHC